MRAQVLLEQYLHVGHRNAGERQERDDAVRQRPIHHYLTYNRSDDANRVQDIVTGLSWLRDQRRVSAVSLAGLDRAGAWALLARTQAPFVARTAVDLNRFANRDQAFAADLLIPAIRSSGDITTAAALVAPGALFLHNPGSALDAEAVTTTYRAAGNARAVRMEPGKADAAAVARYLRG